MATRRIQSRMDIKSLSWKTKTVEERKFVGIEDLVLLADITDHGIVENLNIRLVASEIYTYISNVLIICNPYKWLPLYDLETMSKYAYRNQADNHPHVFFIAENAFRNLVLEEESQCIIITGESGSGKTEASKHIQTYISHVCKGSNGIEKLKEVFMNSNPVLEAFGNAKTLRNNNSSRFGKYFEIKFNRVGSTKGGVITNYLLEKSRVTRLSQGERNFHIFYQLMASMHRSAFKLEGNTDSYHYLSGSGCTTIEGINDVTDFTNTINALYNTGISETDVDSIMSIVAAILHLGNVTFSPMKSESGEDGSIVSNQTALTDFCSLVKLDEAETEFVLTHKELQTTHNGKIESSYTPQNPIRAAERRDSIARSLYERLFSMIISRINKNIDPLHMSRSDEVLLSVGVLDIYGFEIFDKNGFEQICINYVNEKLQQIFVDLVLRAEQEEYTREGVVWAPIPYFNNSVVCELLDGSIPAGLFRMMDDVCNMMHSSENSLDMDKKLLQNASEVHGYHPHFFKTNNGFTIRHYAGDVEYRIGQICETNRDSLKIDLLYLLQTAGETMVSQELYGDDNGNDFKSMITAGSRIRTQCQTLVDTLAKCQPHYIRCIKTNDNKLPQLINKPRVLHQVKYLGLSENIRVKRVGYAFRCEYGRFLDRFYLLSQETFPEWFGTDEEGCRAIIKCVKGLIPALKKESEVQYGSNLIFIQSPETYVLLCQLREERINLVPIPIQRCWRRYITFKQVNKLPGMMSELYSGNKKARNRNSIFREYRASYLNNLGDERAGIIQDGIFRIIDYYNPNEVVKFIDHDASQVVRLISYPFFEIEYRVLVLTDEAVYVMQVLDASAKLKVHPKKTIPDVILRRRIVLQNENVNKGVLEACHVSVLADNFLLLCMKPVPRILDPKTVSPATWPDKESIKSCQRTGKLFSAFEWKKRCKVTGQVLCSAVCDIKQPVPDFGFYESDRVSDDSFGLMSYDQIEDLLVLSPRKTEFLGMLLMEWERIHGNRLAVKFEPLNCFNLRSGPDPPTSRVPAIEVRLQINREKDDNFLFGTMNDPRRTDLLTFQVASGISERVVESRRRRQAERAKKIDLLRQEMEEERQRRRQIRKEERERNRALRQAEKMAINASRRRYNKNGITVPKGSNIVQPTLSISPTVASNTKKDLSEEFDEFADLFVDSEQSNDVVIHDTQVQYKPQTPNDSMRESPSDRKQVISAKLSFENVYAEEKNDEMKYVTSPKASARFTADMLAESYYRIPSSRQSSGSENSSTHYTQHYNQEVVQPHNTTNENVSNKHAPQIIVPMPPKPPPRSVSSEGSPHPMPNSAPPKPSGPPPRPNGAPPRPNGTQASPTYPMPSSAPPKPMPAGPPPKPMPTSAPPKPVPSSYGGTTSPSSLSPRSTNQPMSLATGPTNDPPQRKVLTPSYARGHNSASRNSGMTSAKPELNLSYPKYQTNSSQYPSNELSRPTSGSSDSPVRSPTSSSLSQATIQERQRKMLFS